MTREEFIEKWCNVIDPVGVLSTDHIVESLKQMWEDAHFGECVPNEVMPGEDDDD